MILFRVQVSFVIIQLREQILNVIVFRLISREGWYTSALDVILLIVA